MTSRIFTFDSKQDKYFFFGLMMVILIAIGILSYPTVKAYTYDKLIQKKIVEKRAEMSFKESKSPQEYYKMFKCSCCGRPIDVGCCGDAKEKKKYLDNLLLEGLEEDEVVLKMVKKFGFDALMDPSKEEDIKGYILKQAPKNPPRIEIINLKYDFGTISQKDGVVSTTFTVKNAGKSDLVIENMDTSCMCTSASLIYNGVESPRFSMSMHGENPENFELKLPPGDTAKLAIYYDPMVHGVQKKPELHITREVTIISNDPVDFQKKVKIELTQVP